MLKLLEVKNLITEFHLPGGILRAVDDVSFSIHRGQVLGIVGESGSGKSMMALSILKLVDRPGRIVSGEILYYPQIDPSQFRRDEPTTLLPPIDLLKLSSEDLRKVRGNRIAMIFQEPMTSLNPVFTVGDQIQEGIILHQNLPQKPAREKTLELLNAVGIPDAKKRLHDYPHQLSGGMRQRVMIAMALACDPDLIIADEPTTALDVTIQAQILDLLRRRIEEENRAMILITHDLGVVAETCDRALVMYAGKILEEAPVRLLFGRTKHPYTLGLIASSPPLIPSLDRELKTIEGSVPDLLRLPEGCRFQERCSRRARACGLRVPRMKYVGETQSVRCLNA